MDQPVSERRAHSRFGGPSIAHIHTVLRPGRQVWLVNLSTGGALVEGRRALRPGSRVYVQLSTERSSVGRTAQVLRCTVSSLRGEDGVRYQGAMKFDEQWDALWEDLTHAGYRVPARSESRLPSGGHLLPIAESGVPVRHERGC